MALDAPAGNFRLLRFFTSEWPRHLSFEMWRDLINRKLLEAEVTPAREGPFDVRAHLRVLEGIRFGWGEVDASHYRRTPEVVAADNDDFVLFLNLEGIFVASQSGREIDLRPGDAYLLACSQVATFDRPTKGGLLAVRLPSAALESSVVDLYGGIARVIPRESEALRLLSAYIRSLDNKVPLANAGHRAMVARYAADLIVLMLGATREAAELAESRGLSAVRLKQMKAFIRRNLGRTGLSIGDIAAQHGIAARQAQRLFESDGTTFSEYVQRQRLERVHRALVARSSELRTIGEIALECGFSDLSHFNRAFRRRYGASPSEIRAAR
jgi:AraC-like DNA-binding protein